MIQRAKIASLRSRGAKTYQPRSLRTPTSPPPRPSPAELYEQGKSLRKKCPRQSHATWKAPRDRADPLELLQQSSKGRISDLIPIRYGRMLQSPFTFYRGAALNMAADLASTPSTGLRVQACGDCHLLNFGMFATPERREIFDINDLDETLPAPWEWDVKRLAVSFVLACRNNGFGKSDAKDTALACVRSYRKRMAEYSDMSALEVWYESLDADEIIPTISNAAGRRRIEQRLAKARKQSVEEHEFPKLAEVVGKMTVIRDSPPLIYHLPGSRQADFSARISRAFSRYRETLLDARQTLLERYDIRDVAIKVVGVGSVGTRCGIVLLMSGEHPLFLQIKEAGASVLERFAGKSIYSNHGQRVVNGCRMMQSASDIFLGWTEWEGRHFYVRQLRDLKLKILVETFDVEIMTIYARFCGWALALAHARSGQPSQISGYLGKSDSFDEAIGDFSIAYADQCERDYEVLKKAVRNGKLEVAPIE
jgi:uncharacterized protein (DUF2252 family)